MSALMNEFELVQRRRRRFALLVLLACMTGIGAWLTGPIGVVLIVSGNSMGWVLIAVGVVLLAAMVVAIVAAKRSRIVPESQPGAANPQFDKVDPSANPVGGNSWIGSGIGGING